MLRFLYLFTSLFVISLIICVNGTQLEKNRNDLFEVSELDVWKEDSESFSDLRDETILREDPKLCKTNSDCFYGGTCTKNGTCSCPLGTDGILCENVIACIKHPDMCGNATDAKCVFDVRLKYATCQCDDKKKLYNDFSDRCSRPCKTVGENGTLRNDCGRYGRCIQAFCVCVKGTSGDFCEIIDQCKEMDCGKNDPSATCILGIDGPYCKCKEAYKVFDEKDKVCKGEPCKNNTDCYYNGECTGDGTCSCPEGTYGPLCQYVRGCIENPNMCGNGTDVECLFNVFENRPYCSCHDKKKAFNTFIKKCAEPCQKYVNHKLVREDCGKYGRCQRSFCSCVGGVSGDRCETIDQCASGEVDCSGDPTATCSLSTDETAYCKCNKTYQIFDKTEKRCIGEPCTDDTFCKYGGKCTKEGTCLCPSGTGGPQCQLVYECEKNPDKCGNGTDVKCVFDVDENKAVCMCDDEQKAFDNIEKKCRKTCEHDTDCGLYGSCDKYSFCRCLKGVSGDYCEIIEKCRDLECGAGTNCTLGSDGEAHCICEDPDQGYDYGSKTCKACECGDNSKGCEFREGQKKCVCDLNYFYKENKCEACNCGELSKGCELRDGKKECFCALNYTTIGGTCQKCQCGIGSFHCRMEDEKTKCNCYDLYKQRNDKCEFCDCGIHGGNCSFTDSGEKQCDCKPGFKMLKETGFCTEMCNDTIRGRCQNGGQCQDGLCKCSEDYAGAWCETPKWCMHSRCGHNQDEVRCVWNHYTKEGRCECKAPYHNYVEENRSCSKCDCGDHGRCMVTEKGEKVCICDRGYADHALNCESCDCGFDSTNCSFDYIGKKFCHCKEKFKQQYTNKWGEDVNTCMFCDCGEHGTCRFEGENKVCDCEQNYKVYNGKCRECICGPHGFCSFDSNGRQVCTCDFGYSVLNGTCKRCDCEPSDIRGIGTVCLFEDSVKECHCPRGYESPKNDFCADINECLNATACPANTECYNLPGSYKCECKKGFNVSSLGIDPKRFGCEDINECLEYPCTDSNTICINTPGSYDCKCKEGYYPTSSTSGKYYNPKFATCNREETQWRSASIALGIILSIGIIGVGGYIYYLRKGNRR